MKFTKANIKVPKQLDPRQLSMLISYLIDKTLIEIKVQFQDYARLQTIVDEYKTSEGEKELGSLASSSMKLKSEFLCFVFAIERKYGPVCV